MRRLFHIHLYPPHRRVPGSYRELDDGWSIDRKCRCGKVRRFLFWDWTEEWR